ncbi:MAG: GDP-mannose 4,6-dehydratase [Anaerolineae bacterium]|nr:GDP-mannose 4,6-dehydratase [Anaerolineae bacterium]
MRVLITGVTGLVGSHLADYLLTMEDIEVHGFKRWRSDDRSIAHLYSCVKFHEGDIEDTASVGQTIRDLQPQRIYHLAAQSYPSESWDAPIATVNANIIGTVNLLEAVRHFSPASQVHVAGSSAEYGFISPDEVPISEDHPLRPLSPYGVTKVAQELFGLQYEKNYGIPVYVTRSFNHVGPRQGDRCSIQTFCKQMVEAELGRRDPVIHVGNLEPQRDFTDVRDAVRAFWLLLEKGRSGEVYNLCSGRAVAIQEILDTVLQLGRIQVHVEIDPLRLRPADEPILMGDNTKLRHDTGWAPEIPLKQTVQSILDYWRQRLRAETGEVLD